MNRQECLTELRKSALGAIAVLGTASLATAAAALYVVSSGADPWDSWGVRILMTFWSAHLLLLDRIGVLFLAVDGPAGGFLWIVAVGTTWFLAWVGIVLGWRTVRRVTKRSRTTS